MIKNFFALIGLIVVLFFGLGYWLNWFNFSVKAGANGDHRIELDVKTSKIGEDINRGKEKLISGLKNASPDPQSSDFVGPTIPAANTKPEPTRN